MEKDRRKQMKFHLAEIVKGDTGNYNQKREIELKIEIPRKNSENS